LGSVSEFRVLGEVANAKEIINVSGHASIPPYLSFLFEFSIEEGRGKDSPENYLD
jgi:hypothetical protein